MNNPELDVDQLCAEMQQARREAVAVLRAIPRSAWRTKSSSGWTPAIMASHLVTSDRPGLLWATGAGKTVAWLPGPLLNAGNELMNKITALRSGRTDLHKAATQLEGFERKLVAATRKLTPTQIARPAVGATGTPFPSTYHLLQYLFVEHMREHAADLRPFTDPK